MELAGSRSRRKLASEPRWLRTVIVVHPIVAIVSGLLAIGGAVAGQFEPGAPPPSLTPASATRLQVREEPAIYGWSSGWTKLYGTVPGIEAASRDEYAVIVYTFAWDPDRSAGYWYVQPYEIDCHTRIGSENTWQAAVRRGSEYGVLVARVPAPSGTPAGAALVAGGCNYPQKLFSFPPSQAGAIAWTYVAAKSKWTPVFYIGLGGLLAAAVMLGVRLLH